MKMKYHLDVCYFKQLILLFSPINSLFCTFCCTDCLEAPSPLLNPIWYEVHRCAVLMTCHGCSTRYLVWKSGSWRVEFIPKSHPSNHKAFHTSLDISWFQVVIVFAAPRAGWNFNSMIGLLYFLAFICVLSPTRISCSDVLDLDLANFERLTKVASGHTTGDWLVKVLYGIPNRHVYLYRDYVQQKLIIGHDFTCQ